MKLQKYENEVSLLALSLLTPGMASLSSFFKQQKRKKNAENKDLSVFVNICSRFCLDAKTMFFFGLNVLF